MRESHSVESEHQLINLRAALDAIGGDRELLHELTEICREDAPPLLVKLRDEVERSDWVAVRSTAHAIKGLCSSFHSEEHFHCAELVEHAARDRDRETMVHESSRLIQLTDQLLREASNL